MYAGTEADLIISTISDGDQRKFLLRVYRYERVTIPGSAMYIKKARQYITGLFYAYLFSVNAKPVLLI